jgi:hypothetical protein
MFAWSQLDFSAIPVSISAVFLTSRQTLQNVVTVREDCKEFKIVQEGKRYQKKDTSDLCSFCFWGEVSNS